VCLHGQVSWVFQDGHLGLHQPGARGVAGRVRFHPPQLCEEDGDRFLADILKSKRKMIVAGCAPNMQRKMFRDAFAAAGMDIATDLAAIDIRDMTTDEAVEKISAALSGMKEKRP
jgi:hypothetical protein